MRLHGSATQFSRKTGQQLFVIQSRASSAIGGSGLCNVYGASNGSLRRTELNNRDRGLYQSAAMKGALDRRFKFDGKRISFREGDTIGSALHRAGVRTISRSMKYHRPRGLYCCVGSCASCLVDVDGVPNLPACMTSPEDGGTVNSQNRIGSAKRDLLAVTDTAFSGGFEPHNAFTRPRIINNIFLRAVRFMSGWGKAPRVGTESDSSPRRHTLHVDEIIVGAGKSGIRRASATDSSSKVLIVDERPIDSVAPKHVEVWPNSIAFGIYNDVIAVRRGADLWEITADRVTLCTGVHDDWPIFVGNDRPGVLSLRGATRLLGEHGVLPGKRVVGHGAQLPQDFIQDLESATGTVVAEGIVSEVHGAPVRKAKVDGQWHSCDAVVCNLPGVPRNELFQQAGCELAWSDDNLRPVTGANGATSNPIIFAGIP
jgi:sarcosine oxidase subunit alpha